MSRFIKKIKNIVIEIFFPSVCVSCEKYLHKEKNMAICKECLDSVKTNNGFFCSKCGKRIATAKNRMPKKCCGEIALAAVCPYENNTIRKILHSFKYNGITMARNPIEKIMEEYTRKIKLEERLRSKNSWIIVPTPLHPTKRRARGFNQSEDIANVLGKLLEKEVETKCLVRIKNTAPQAKMGSKDERQSNVSESFFVTEEERLKNKNVVLVDDIFTTGATMKEAAKTLKKSGAKRIVGFVVAKT